MLARAEIEEALTTLADRLAAKGARFRIHVLGSAALVLSGLDRPPTNDVDGAASERAMVLEVVADIADERGWRRDWFSDGVTQFLPDYGAPQWWTFVERGGVEVVVAPYDLMLAMKLHAGRGRRDEEDVVSLVRALGLGSRAEARQIFETYYPHDELKPTSVRWLATLLPEDEPRAP